MQYLKLNLFFTSKACATTYLGVVLLSVDLTFWDRELDEGVFDSWCSGVVRGPSTLTSQMRERGREGANHSIRIPCIQDHLSQGTLSAETLISDLLS